MPTVACWGSSTTRYIRPGPVMSTYRRWRTRTCASLSGPPRCRIISGALSRRSRSRSPSCHGSILTSTMPASLMGGRWPRVDRTVQNRRMYLIRERFFHMGDASEDTDESGQPVLLVDGKVLSLRNRLVIRDPAGREVASVHRHLIALRPTYEVTIGGGADGRAA